MTRCQHEPVKLFDAPPEGASENTRVMAFLNSYAHTPWVICRRCGMTGYWGGYGIKRRVRWGYGDDRLLQIAEEHNRLMRCDVEDGPSIETFTAADNIEDRLFAHTSDQR